MQSKYNISFDLNDKGNKILIQFPFDKDLLNIVKELQPPPYWDKVEKCWHTTNNNPVKIIRVLEYFLKNNIRCTLSERVKDAYKKAKDFITKRADQSNFIQEIKKRENTELDVSKWTKYIPLNFQKNAIYYLELVNGCAVIALKPGYGKAQPKNCIVYTPNGEKKLKDLKLGDEILNSYGGISNVLGIFEQGKIKTYKITFSDKTYTYCSEEHLWNIIQVSNLTHSNLKTRNRTLTTKEIIEVKKTYNNNWKIPITNPVKFNPKKVQIDPYVLGCLLGDGCLSIKNTVLFSTSDAEIRNFINERIKKNGVHLRKLGNYDYRISNCRDTNNSKNNIVREIKELKLNGTKSDTKFIPDVYKYNSKKVRIELLQGLLDTDGSYHKSGNSIYYYTVSKKLCDDVRFLVQSLGGTVGISIKKKPKYTYNGEVRYGKDCYVITIRLPKSIKPFKLSRKIKIWNNKVEKYTPIRVIKKIEPVGKKDSLCILTSAKDSLYLTNDFIVTHNTFISTLYAYKNDFKTLVVCLSTLKKQWQRKGVNKFFPNATSQILHAGDLVDCPSLYDKRKNIRREEVNDFTIVNYDLLMDKNKNKKIKKDTPAIRTLESLKLAIERGVFDLIIIDESQKIKNDKTKWTQFIHSHCSKIQRRLLLSGTPIQNKPIEYFSQLKFVDKKYWSSKTDFAYRFAAPEHNGFGMSFNGASNLEELYYETQPYVFREESDEIEKQLPKIQIIPIPLELTDKERKEYKNLEGEVSRDLRELDDEEDNKGKKSIGSLAIVHRLKEFTSNIKKKNAEEIIENIIETGEKVAVFSEYKVGLRYLHETFGEDTSVLYTGDITSSKKKDELVQRFVHDINCKIFLTTRQSGGTGLDDLQLVCNTGIGLDQPWTFAEFEQTYKRLQRIGADREKPVKMYVLICEDTIDELVYDLLDFKQGIVTKVMDNKEYVNEHEESPINEVIKHYKKLKQ